MTHREGKLIFGVGEWVGVLSLFLTLVGFGSAIVWWASGLTTDVTSVKTEIPDMVKSITTLSENYSKLDGIVSSEHQMSVAPRSYTPVRPTSTSTSMTDATVKISSVTGSP